MENDTAPKRPGKIRRILRGLFLTAKWLFVLLLTILLVAGLIFKAPWKVIALLTILIITPTIIPRRIRKYIYLTYAIILLSLSVWVLLPEDNSGWEPYTFDRELAELEARRAVPDDLNAALKYEKLFTDHDLSELEFEIEGCLPDNLSYTDYEYQKSILIAGELAACEPVLNEVLGITELQHCRFPAGVTSESYWEVVERSGKIRNLYELLTYSADNDLRAGKPGDAIKKRLAILQLANHVYQQPLLIEVFTGYALEGVAVAGLAPIIASEPITQEQLQTIDQAIGNINFVWEKNWPIIIDAEKLHAKNQRAMFYERNSDGKIRYARCPQCFVAPEDRCTLGFGLKKLFKAYTIGYWFYMPPTPHSQAAEVEQHFQQYYQMAEPNYPWPAEEPDIAAAMRNLPSSPWQPVAAIYISSHDIYLRYLAGRRMTRILIALRSFKNANRNWPDSLKQILPPLPPEILTDPFTKDAFIYQRIDDTFTLYSKGKNGVDDGGVGDRNIGADDVLVWPVGY